MWSAISRASRHCARRPLDEAGVAALEFGLIAVVFMTLLFGIMDLALYFATQQAVRTVASDAVRAALTDPNWTFACAAPTSGTAATVVASTPLLVPSSVTLCVTQAVAGGTTTISVRASYPFSFIIPGLSYGGTSISDTLTMTY